jgi:hypothetical protein
MMHDTKGTKGKGKGEARTSDTSSGSLNQGDFPTKASSPKVPVACTKAQGKTGY